RSVLDTASLHDALPIFAVAGGRIDRHIGMRRAEMTDTFGRGKQAEEANVLRPAFLQRVDGGDGGIARRQHRVDDDDEPLADTVGDRKSTRLNSSHVKIS